MAEDSGQTVLPVLIDQIVPLVDGLTDRLKDGIDVLDVGCGSGLAMVLLADAFPNSQFTGVDISAEGLERGRAEAAKRGIRNVRFEQRDATQMWYENQFDLVTTFDSVHDQRDPSAMLGEIHRAMRPAAVHTSCRTLHRPLSWKRTPTILSALFSTQFQRSTA